VALNVGAETAISNRVSVSRILMVIPPRVPPKKYRLFSDRSPFTVPSILTIIHPVSGDIENRGDGAHQSTQPGVGKRSFCLGLAKTPAALKRLTLHASEPDTSWP
jgi:hypothetical protein